MPGKIDRDILAYQREHTDESDLVDLTVQYIINKYGIHEADLLIPGGLSNAQNYVRETLKKSGVTIGESLKYPNRAYSRKTSAQARRRASAVSAEGRLEDRLDVILDDDNALYRLIDETAQRVIYSDILTEQEAERRNSKLIAGEEPFRWLK